MPPARTPAIRTPDQRLRVFISSTLEELAPERRAAREAVAGLHLTPVFFEAGARPHPARELYRAYLAQSDVFIGIYWQRYGWVAPEMGISGLEEEYRLSEGKPRLLYIKRPAPQREPALQKLLDHICLEDGTTFQKFTTPAELQELLADDLAQLLTEHFTLSREELPLPPLQSAPLPRPRSPLIDRTQELADAQGLLLRDEVGMVTLTGVGGVGKTRLAIQVASQIAGQFADGAAFVSLAPVKEPDLLVPTIARALQIPGERSRPLAESLLEYLGNSHLLLVIDNLEQLISTAPQISQFLEFAPNLKLLITSREALRIRGEWTVQISPLALPDPTHLPGLEGLGQIPAVALFLQRAHEGNRDFSLTPENARDIAEICQRLDGLPLALELAAARINVLPPKVLLSRLSRRLPFLTRGARDLPERQQTLRNMIAWSYDLLEPPEQRLFRSLAAFDGSFGTDGAVAVEGDGSSEQKTMDSMLDRLESLVGKNLLRIEQGPEGTPRFFMLDTIREYAQEQLETHGGQAAAQERHAHFFLTLAQAAEPHLYQPERDTWVDRLEIEDVNLRAALTWCRENSNAVESGLRLAGALSMFWFLKGYLREGRSWLETMLARSANRHGIACGKALFGAGLLSWKQGDADAGAHYSEDALSIFNEEGDTLFSGYSGLVLGIARMGQGRLAEACLVLEECLGKFRKIDSAFGEAIAFCWMGINTEISGKREQSLCYYEESLHSFERAHDELFGSVLLSVLVALIATHGDKETARSFLEKFQDLLRQARNPSLFGMFLLTSGYDLQNNYKQYETAKVLYRGSLSFWQDIQRLQSGVGIVSGLAGLAEIAAIQGQGDRAGWLFGAADHLAPPSGFYRDALNERAAQLQAHLDATTTAAFKAAWAGGQTATLEQAIQTALQEAT